MIGNILDNIAGYALFLIVNLIFIILVLRAFYYALIIKQDPIKAIKPDIVNSGLYKWLVLREAIKKNKETGHQMS